MSQIADAPVNNWVDSRAPEFTRPYLKLARADRPIGIWLLLWPCWWSLALVQGTGEFWTNIWFFILFAVGATVMRAAGCTYNDILDRHYDGKVARTRNRPIPSGQVSVKQAAVFMVACCLIGLFVLLQFNLFTILLGFCSLGIVAIYPLMKRITHWPQLVLGLAFSWGALMGWSSAKAELDWAPVFLYLSVVFWTIGYDTIYAHQDKEDDALLGLKSTALLFGSSTKSWLTLFYGLTILFLFLAGTFAYSGLIFYLGLAIAALHLLWQIFSLDIEDEQNCLTRFRANRDFGTLVFLTLLLDWII